jgi:hypothetical protein
VGLRYWQVHACIIIDVLLCCFQELLIAVKCIPINAPLAGLTPSVTCTWVCSSPLGQWLQV